MSIYVFVAFATFTLYSSFFRSITEFHLRPCVMMVVMMFRTMTSLTPAKPYSNNDDTECDDKRTKAQNCRQYAGIR
jgi:hypothetical protein